MRIFLFLLFACCFANTAQAEQPNVIVILADDLGYSDIGAYGGEIDTPNLDAMAAGGAQLQSFYNMGRCSPSRAALLTGRYPHEVGMGHLPLPFNKPGYRGVLDETIPTLPELLQAQGYRSYMVGKWHLTTHQITNPKQVTEEARASWPIGRGFDRFYGTIQGAGSYYNPVDLVADEALIEAPEDFYYTDAMTDKAIAFIQDHKRDYESAPFFFYVAYTAPHWPLHAKPEDIAKYRDRYRAGWDQLRAARLERMKTLGLLPQSVQLSERPETIPPFADAPNKDWEVERMATYAAMVDNMDQNIGRLLSALEEQGARDDTLILFMSDNGASTEEPGGITANPIMRALMSSAGLSTTPIKTRDGEPIRPGADPAVPPGPETSYMGYGPAWANLSNTPFRLHKQFAHEGGIKSPLIAYWPNGINARQAALTARGHIIDIAPTVLSAAGHTPVDMAMHGTSLLPILTGDTQQSNRTLYVEHQGNKALLAHHTKLVATHKGEWELYDLIVDPVELTDLATANPDRVHALAGQWQDWASKSKVEPWSARMIIAPLPWWFKLAMVGVPLGLLVFVLLGFRNGVRAIAAGR